MLYIDERWWHETENAIYSNIETNFKIESKTIKILRFLDWQHWWYQQSNTGYTRNESFLELKSSKNYDNQQFIESISNKRSLKDDLYYQLYAYTHPYNEDVMTYLIESLDDSGFLSYPLDQYMSDLHIDQDILMHI